MVKEFLLTLFESIFPVLKFPANKLYSNHKTREFSSGTIPFCVSNEGNKKLNITFSPNYSFILNISNVFKNIKIYKF